LAHIEGFPPYRATGGLSDDHGVAAFVLTHRHAPDECAAAFAAWKGYDSHLRHTVAEVSCMDGGHHAWWHVEAASPDDALRLLPPFVASRTEVQAVRVVEIP
jgi:hypothetical protein